MHGRHGCKPNIQYPCRWHYRLIGEDPVALHRAITTRVAVAACVISEANVSSGGRFCSLNLEVTVRDEAERLRLYQLLSGDPAVRMVL
jgi:uncharacterized protein